MIQAKSLSKFYEGQPAIENVSFEIAAGEIVGLLGLNGAGKSTILKILGCFLIPSDGDATIGGYSVTEEPDQVRRLIGYLPDTPPLYDEMRVQDYLKYTAALNDVASVDLKSAVETAMEKTSLGQVRNQILGTLSHGFRQRVGIAQAVVHKPKVLILDEPINGLDPIQIVEMRDLVLSLREEHTVILSSHILSEIIKTCDQMLIIDKGKLLAQSKPGDWTEKHSFDLRVITRNDSENLTASLKSIPSVTDAKRLAAREWEVVMARDVRDEIAKVVVESGLGLIGLESSSGGLETLFMKFLNPTEKES